MFIQSDGVDPTSAMTEIALALAMAFFTIFVLAAVSMGSSPGSRAAVPEAPALTLEADEGQGGGAASDEGWLIYFGGHFYDLGLRPVDPARQAAAKYLAVAPGLSIAEVLALTAQFSGPKPAISLLQEPWLSKLEARQ